jgi:hypothetical protein
VSIEAREDIELQLRTRGDGGKEQRERKASRGEARVPRRKSCWCVRPDSPA